MKWTKEYRRNYRKVVKARRKEMRQAGGILKVASYLLSDNNIYDDTIYEYLRGIYIECDLYGPCSHISSSFNFRGIRA